MHSTYRSCLFSVVLMLSIAFHANTSEVNYCPCTCSSPPSSYGAPTAALFSPPSLFSNSGSYGAPVAAGNPSPSLLANTGPYGRPTSTETFLPESQQAPHNLGAPATYGASQEHPSQHSAPTFAFAQQKQGPISESTPASVEQLFHVPFQQTQIHSIPGQNNFPVASAFTPILPYQFEDSVGLFNSLNKLNERLISTKFLNGHSAIMPAGYLISLASIIRLFNGNEDNAKQQLIHLIDLQCSPDEILEEVGRTLSSLHIPYQHHFLVLNGDGKIGDEARSLFKKHRIIPFATEDEVTRQAVHYRPYGMEQIVESGNPAKLFVSLLEGPEFAWFHRFKRSALRSFGTEAAPTRTAFVQTKSLFRAVKKSGEWKAVELPLYREQADQVEMDSRAGNVMWEAFAALQHESLAVYLIGPNDATAGPPPTSKFFKDVHNELIAAKPSPVDLHFPAFRVIAGTNLGDNKVPELPGMNQEKMFEMLADKVVFEAKQGINLCADQHGMNSLRSFSSDVQLPADTEFTEYMFDKPFYFAIVHKQTGVPLVIANVQTGLDGEMICL